MNESEAIMNDHAKQERASLIRDDTAFKQEQKRRKALMLLGSRWLLHEDNRVTKESYRASLRRVK